MGQGDAVIHIYPRNLSQLELCMPSLEEQTSIAAVLTDMDTELGLHHQTGHSHRSTLSYFNSLYHP